MNIIEPAIERYLHELSNPDDSILREMELLGAERSFPIVVPQVGGLLKLLASAISARRVIELGSGFGYSAYWFARAVGPEGFVILTESSAEHRHRETRAAPGLLASQSGHHRDAAAEPAGSEVRPRRALR